jgi:hypothetical protein
MKKLYFESHTNIDLESNPNLTLKTMHAWNMMWRLQAYAFAPHMLDVVGIEIFLGLFVMSSTEQFHYTCLSVAIATHKNRMRGTMDNWSLGCKWNVIVWCTLHSNHLSNYEHSHLVLVKRRIVILSCMPMMHHIWPFLWFLMREIMIFCTNHL